jgi:integrase
MSVKQLADGNWFYRFHCGKRQYREQGFKTRADAEKAETIKKSEAVRRNSNGRDFNDGLRLGDACDTYYEENTLPLKKNYKSDRAHIKAIKAFFGNQRIRDISQREVDSFRRWVLKTAKGKSKPKVSLHTVNRYHACLKAIINWTKKKRMYFGENPAWGVEMAKVEKARVRFLFPEEEKRLTPIVARYTRLWPFYVMGLQTGMRVSEICSIRVKDVVLHPTPMVFVAHSKSKCSRYVPLSEMALQVLLERVKDYQDEPERRAIDLVNRETVSEWFKDACQEAKVPEFTFHCLRHTFAGHMLSKGVPIYKVSKMLGHSTVLTTEAHYGHLDRRVLSDEIHKVDSIMTVPKTPEATPTVEKPTQVVNEVVNSLSERVL